MTTTNPDDGTLARSEPLLSVAGVTAAIAAGISLAVSFGFELTEDQQLSLMALTAVLAPLAVALIARKRVYSPASVDAIEQRALDTPAPGQLEHAPSGLWDGGTVGLEEDLVALEAMEAEEMEPADEEAPLKSADELDKLPVANSSE